METFEIRHLNFRYPNGEKNALTDISMKIYTGQITLICGKSGSGKTTLLHRLKSCLAAKGMQSGEVLFSGIPLKQIPYAEQARRIGFVQQHPDDQLVTDKVFHELAFGLESLGYDQQKMRLRTAETASFFGISEWFRQDVESLSGGYKQLLNLASVVSMDPEVLILDEPTSQLDPVAATRFLAMIRKLNEELGLTIVLTEHRLEEVLGMADQLAILDEGNLIAFGETKKVIAQVNEESVLAMFPTSVRLFKAAGANGLPPLTINEGREWLKLQKIEQQTIQKEKCPPKGMPFLSLKECHFRYKKDGPEILDGLSIALRRGEIYGLVGANGSGKSTTLGVLSGIYQPYRGGIYLKGQKIKRLKSIKYGIAAVPQDPRCLFVGQTAEADLREMSVDESKLQKIIELLGIQSILKRHPYDLSGGEQQRLAIGKVLLANPSVLLLDEPTKGMDGEFKEVFGEILKKMAEHGISIFLVSHDIEFCASYADRCGLLFGGRIISENDTHLFFEENRFYTTATLRMCRGILPGIVNCEEAVKCIRK